MHRQVPGRAAPGPLLGSQRGRAVARAPTRGDQARPPLVPAGAALRVTPPRGPPHPHRNLEHTYEHGSQFRSIDGRPRISYGWGTWQSASGAACPTPTGCGDDSGLDRYGGVRAPCGHGLRVGPGGCLLGQPFAAGYPLNWTSAPLPPAAVTVPVAELVV